MGTLDLDAIVDEDYEAEAAALGITVDELDRRIASEAAARSAGEARQPAETHLDVAEAGLTAVSGLPFKVYAATAYSPSQRAGTFGYVHLVAGEPVSIGRFQRKTGQAQCRTDHWGLASLIEGQYPATITALEQVVNCPQCLERARSLAAAATK